jgi:hypothetical protein
MRSGDDYREISFPRKVYNLVPSSRFNSPLYTHHQIPLMVLLMKVWIVVYNYGLINDDVRIFSTLEDARRGFREYTGFPCSSL